MKVVTCLILLLCALFPPLSVFKAEADGGVFAYVKTDCYFYYTSDLKNGVFLLPESYFVKILDDGDNYYRIEYLTDGMTTKKLTGYCRKEKVSLVDYQPTNPYLYRFFDVTYQTDGGEGDGFLTQITFTCAYYGDYYIGTNAYCYVLRGDSLGYVPKPAGFTYEKNPEYEQRLPPQKDTPVAATSPPAYAYFVGVILLAPVAAYLLFKCSKRPFEPTDER